MTNLPVHMGFPVRIISIIPASLYACSRTRSAPCHCTRREQTGGCAAALLAVGRHNGGCSSGNACSWQREGWLLQWLPAVGRLLVLLPSHAAMQARPLVTAQLCSSCALHLALMLGTAANEREPCEQPPVGLQLQKPAVEDSLLGSFTSVMQCPPSPPARLQPAWLRAPPRPRCWAQPQTRGPLVSSCPCCCKRCCAARLATCWQGVPPLQQEVDPAMLPR